MVQQNHLKGARKKYAGKSLRITLLNMTFVFTLHQMTNIKEKKVGEKISPKFADSLSFMKHFSIFELIVFVWFPIHNFTTLL